MSKVDDRLVEYRELAAGECSPQVRLDPAPEVDLDPHLGLEMLELTTPGELGPVKRDVGMFE